MTANQEYHRMNGDSEYPETLRWQYISKRMLAKMLREFDYEQLLKLEVGSANHWRLPVSEGVFWEFAGERDQLGHLWVQPGSVKRHSPDADGSEADPVTLILDIAPLIGMTPFTLTHWVRELRRTQFFESLLEERARKIDEIAGLSLPEMETAISGHPWFVPSKGRIGFSVEDTKLYAPEMLRDQPLAWLGVAKEIVESATVTDVSYSDFLESELGAEVYKELQGKLQDRGADPEQYVLFPVHPWQVDNVVTTDFAAEIACRKIICLGTAGPNFLPLQSVRSWANRVNPRGSSIKLALSILTTSVYRGLDPQRAIAAPRLTSWLKNSLSKDAFLTQQQPLFLLGEIAGAAVQHPAFKQIKGAPYQFRDTLASIWRENPNLYVEEGDQVVPLGALCHEDSKGNGLVTELVKRSGLEPAVWVERLFACAVVPFYHVLCRYGVAFNPHGQNGMVVLRGGVPVAAVIRDFIDDINICKADFPELANFPKELRVENGGIVASLEADFLTHFIFTSQLLCVMRYVARILSQSSLQVSEADFWRAGRRAFDSYIESTPELAERRALFDMLKPKFDRLCINRLRLLTHGYGESADRPVFPFQGLVDNPLTLFM